MRKSQRVLALILMLGFVGVCAGVAASQTSTGTSTSKASPTGDDDGDETGGLRGEADDAPRLGGVVIGLLVVAVLALMFAAYMRFRG